MMLDALLADFGATGSTLGIEVHGVSCDSRRVEKGDLFAALSGEKFDGRRFVPQALAAGAVAVLAEDAPTEEVGVPWLVMPELRARLGPIAARIYRHPDREMTVVGVTGTNGKSTIVRLLEAILEATGRPTGHLGTVGYRFRDQVFEGERTTPEAPQVFSILRRIREQGAEAVAMEVTSHALDRHRVEGLHFDAAVFTNLTRDHLDYHGDLETYFAAKRTLFDKLTPEGTAVVNVDDPFGRRLAEELPRVVTYGRRADVHWSDLELTLEGTRGRVESPRGPFQIDSQLLGRFNAENLAAAVAVGVALRLSRSAIEGGLGGVRPVTGRMEPVPNPEGLSILIDYAHTPAALEAALSSLRELASGRLIAVFGCGGDRDRGKRGPMGEIAGRLADLPVATSDNPRTEDPLSILREVENGLRQSGNETWRLVPDRREAIRRAVSLMERGDTLLIAGKGHETKQILGDQVLPFEDRAEIQQALEARRGALASD